MKNRIVGLFLCLVFLLWSGVASAAPLDLSTFIKDPVDANVVIDSTNGTITLNEDDYYAAVYAADDSFEVPLNATTLTYSYSLTPGSDYDYDWLFTIINYDIYPMAIERIGTGIYSIDMTSYAGQTISLAFGLEYDSNYDQAFTSVGIITNIDLATASGTNPVPEPATMLLLGSGLVGLVGMGRRKFFKKS